MILGLKSGHESQGINPRLCAAWMLSGSPEDGRMFLVGIHRFIGSTSICTLNQYLCVNFCRCLDLLQYRSVEV